MQQTAFGNRVHAATMGLLEVLGKWIDIVFVVAAGISGTWLLCIKHVRPVRLVIFDPSPTILGRSL